MKLYIRKLNSQQCTNKSISVTMPIFKGFFEDSDVIYVKGKKSGQSGKAPFTFTRDREDPRFGGVFKEVLRAEGNGSFKIGDILVVEKGSPNYIVSLITEEDSEYDTFDLLLKNGIHSEIHTDDGIDEDTATENDIFSGFEPWLTSYNNPDYTGKQKYTAYAKAIVKLADFMYSQNMIEDSDLNDKKIEKYISWVEIYEGSEEAKTFDEKKNSNKAGSAALKKYIKYIKYLITPHSKEFDYSTTKMKSVNKIFYGVPGCGKSHYIEHDLLGKDKVTKTYTGDYKKDNIIRTTFYQDYSNTDFVGQILPKIVKGENGEKDTVEYIFNPGPFTLALIRAISNPTEKVALIIEEINRGNAPAIFGDIFQLLDRDDNSLSEYGIVNVSVMDYLNSYEFEVDGEKKRYTFSEIKIPGNIDIFATMNTSDQNVYTLDTAFTRRWSKERMPNDFNGNEIKDMRVPGMYKYTWKEFVDTINGRIQDKLDDLQVNEDKQVGAFFVKKADLLPKDTTSDDTEKAKAFAYKVIEYLWDDVSKLDHSVIFNPSYNTFEKLVDGYVKNGVTVFNNGIFTVKSEENATENAD